MIAHPQFYAVVLPDFSGTTLTLVLAALRVFEAWRELKSDDRRGVKAPPRPPHEPAGEHESESVEDADAECHLCRKQRTWLFGRVEDLESRNVDLESENEELKRRLAERGSNEGEHDRNGEHRA